MKHESERSYQMEKFIKAKDLAKALDIDVRTIQTAFKKGQIAGKTINTVLFIAESSLEPYSQGTSVMEQRYKKRIEALERENEQLRNLMQKVAGQLLQGV